jgi:DNA mismatch repair ATPase MutS
MSDLAGCIHSQLLGIDLACLADLPDDIMHQSRQIAEKLTVDKDQQDSSSESAQIAARRKALLKVHADPATLRVSCSP